jgi:hypothetical protein
MEAARARQLNTMNNNLKTFCYFPTPKLMVDRFGVVRKVPRAKPDVKVIDLTTPTSAAALGV